jgi:hypothetical protein
VFEDRYNGDHMRINAFLLLLLSSAGCQQPTEPSTPVMTGVIVARDMSISIGGPPTIHVKESEDQECGVIFLVRSTTPILRRPSVGSTTPGTIADLTVGRHVKVWASYVLESCPGQSKATAVEIIDG